MNNWICKNCGEQNPAVMRFCQNCGRENVAEEPPPTVFVSPSAPPPASPFSTSPFSTQALPPAASAPKKGFPWLWVLLGGGAIFLVLLIVGGGILAFVLTSDFNSSGNVKNDQPANNLVGVNSLPPEYDSKDNSKNNSKTPANDEEKVTQTTENLIDACLANDLTKAKTYVKNDEANAAEFCNEVRINLSNGYKIWGAAVETVGQETVGVVEVSKKGRSKGDVYFYFTKQGGEFLYYKLKEIGETSDSKPPTQNMNTGGAQTISGGVLNGKAVSLPKPAYPPAARAVNASGAVNVQVTVDESGSVASADAVSGHPLLRSSAVSAAREAKFTPTLKDGSPVKVSGVIVYNFTL